MVKAGTSQNPLKNFSKNELSDTILITHPNKVLYDRRQLKTQESTATQEVMITENEKTPRLRKRNIALYRSNAIKR